MKDSEQSYSGFAIAGFDLEISAFVLFFAPFLNVILAIVAIILFNDIWRVGQISLINQN